MADDLMLTSAGLLRGRFKIAAADEKDGAKPGPAARSVTGVVSARDRLQVVQGGKTG